MRARSWVSTVVAWVLVTARVAIAQPDESKKSEAQAHFQRGLELSAEEAWDAAYAEYAQSRRLYPTKAATKNAALSLRKLRRFDEALELLESLLRDFPSLTDQDRVFARNELEQLKPLIAVVEVSGPAGATITVDGRERGQLPLARPLRVSGGSHVIRGYLAGFTPYETRVDVSGGQRAPVQLRLEALTTSGRVRVREATDARADVVVDGVVVGAAPWEGAMAVGTHTIALRGAGNLGTQPVSLVVTASGVAPLALSLEALEAELRVEPTPANAVVAVDGVALGRGVWDGRARAGEHKIEVAEEGFVPVTRTVSIDRGGRRTIAVTLDRDLTSPLWGATAAPHFYADARVGFLIGPSLGGDAVDSCTGRCSTALPIGGVAGVRLGYQLASGLGFSLDVGYGIAQQNTSGREDSLTILPAGGPPPNRGSTDDQNILRGVLAGLSASVHRGESLTWMARLGAGVWLASLRDMRSGQYTTGTSLRPDGSQGPATAYNVGPLSQVDDARYGYLSPELRLGWRLGEHAEIAAGVETFFFLALKQPRWAADRTRVNAGTCSSTSPSADCVTDGLGAYEDRPTAGRFVILVSPGLVFRYRL